MRTVVRTDDAAFLRDAALFKVISQHGFRPVVWQVTPAEGAELATKFAKLFGFEPRRKVEAETDAKHAPLFRAIKQSSGR